MSDKPTVSVDFDGTIVTHEWPGVGTPQPGMIAAMKELQKIANPIVFSCRVAPFEIDGYTVRPPAAVQEEVDKITHTLEQCGIYNIPVWTKPWKPLAAAYIDDRAVAYNGRENGWWHAYHKAAALIHADNIRRKAGGA